MSVFERQKLPSSPLLELVRLHRRFCCSTGSVFGETCSPARNWSKRRVSGATNQAQNTWKLVEGVRNNVCKISLCLGPQRLWQWWNGWGVTKHANKKHVSSWIISIWEPKTTFKASARAAAPASLISFDSRLSVRREVFFCKKSIEKTGLVGCLPDSKHMEACGKDSQQR